MSQYLLPSYVHVCATTQMAIFLDLRHDQYIGLDNTQVGALRTLVRGWPDGPVGPERLGTDEEAVAFADRLVGKGLLTRSEQDGKDAVPPTIDSPESVIAETFSLTNIPPIRARHVLAFVRACTSAWIALKGRSLEDVVRRIEMRKTAESAAHTEFEQLRELVVAFYRTRQFFYTSRDNCLFDSLAMIEFLAAYRMYPTLVIGVQPKPFLAHAWLQHGRHTLNCAAEFARRFTPILVI